MLQTKLVLWEDAIEKIHIGKGYHIENCKVRVFEDSKFLNTNAFTKIAEIDQIPNINLTTPHLQDNIVTCQCLGVNIKCTISCLCCNETIEDSQIVEDTVTCLNCNMTIIKDVLQTKVVAQLLMKIDGKMVNYTAFNDAIESFLSNIKSETSLLKITSTEFIQVLTTHSITFYLLIYCICCRVSARQHTILDVLRILQSSLDPVFCADLCIVEKSIRIGRLDVHFPGEKVEFQVIF